MPLYMRDYFGVVHDACPVKPDIGDPITVPLKVRVVCGYAGDLALDFEAKAATCLGCMAGPEPTLGDRIQEALEKIADRLLAQRKDKK